MMGAGLSLGVHVIIFILMITSPFWSKSSRPMPPPYATVKLVSMEEIGSGPLPAPKGTVSNSSEVGKSKESRKTSESSKAKSAPVVPVKRLNVAEAPAKPVTELKKYEAPEVPKVTENVASSTAAVDKSLEKLITKPKPAPKPTPIVQQGPKEEPIRQASPAKAAPTPAAPDPNAKPVKNTAQSQAAPDPNAKAGQNTPQSSSSEGTADAQGKGKSAGHPQGQGDATAKGTADGQGEGKGGWGSPEGSRVTMALLSMYGQKVKDVINRQWMIPESVKPQGLEARLAVVVSRDGKVLDLRVEKGSGNSLFDESALRAVRKASPLPPLPEIYSSPTLEFDIRFRPEGLS